MRPSTAIGLRSSRSDDWVAPLASRRSTTPRTRRVRKDNFSIPSTASSGSSIPSTATDASKPYLAKGWASAYWMAHATEATEAAVPRAYANRNSPRLATRLVERLRRGARVQSQRNPQRHEEGAPCDDAAGDRWIDRMQVVVGRRFKTVRNIRLQDAYDNLRNQDPKKLERRQRHSLHASQDRYIQREFSHTPQFSSSRFEIGCGIPRSSDTTRRTQFIGGTGVLVR